MELKHNKLFSMRMPEHELAILKAYCIKTGRTQSDVLREYIRSLEKKI